jgi:hypothetical protein
MIETNRIQDIVVTANSSADKRYSILRVLPVFCWCFAALDPEETSSSAHELPLRPIIGRRLTQAFRRRLIPQIFNSPWKPQQSRMAEAATTKPKV